MLFRSIYNDITNKTEAALHPNFDKVNLIEEANIEKSTETNNEFKNITVVKQIEENEQVLIENLRIERVWNKFVQEEVNKIVEEVNNSSEVSNQENIINQNNNLYSSSTTNQNFNNSEYNFNEGDRSNVEKIGRAHV